MFELFVISATLSPAANLYSVNQRLLFCNIRAAPEAPPNMLARLKIDGRGLTLLSTLQFKADRLTLVQGLHPGALNGRNMDEYVLGAVGRLNETKAFLWVEPLYST